MEFNVEDKVNIYSKSTGDPWDTKKQFYLNNIGIIKNINSSYIEVWTEDKSNYYHFLEKDLKKLTKFNPMKTLNNMMKRLLDADLQSLLKAEYINGDLELTSKGKDALLAMLFTDKKADLVVLANQEIAEAEKAKA